MGIMVDVAEQPDIKGKEIQVYQQILVGQFTTHTFYHFQMML